MQGILLLLGIGYYGICLPEYIVNFGSHKTIKSYAPNIASGIAAMCIAQYFIF